MSAKNLMYVNIFLSKYFLYYEHLQDNCAIVLQIMQTRAHAPTKRYTVYTAKPHLGHPSSAVLHSATLDQFHPAINRNATVSMSRI